MRQRWFHTVLLLVATVAIAVLFRGATRNGSQESALVDTAVTNLNERCQELDSLVLAKKIGFVANDEEISRVQAQVSQTINQVNSYNSLGKSDSPATNALNDQLLPLVHRKLELLGEYESSISNGESNAETSREALAKFLAVPVGKTTDEIRNTLAKDNEKLSTQAGWCQLGLIALVALASGFCVYQVVLLVRQQRVLADENQRLLGESEEQASGPMNAEVAERENEKGNRHLLVAQYTDDAAMVTNLAGEIEWVNDGFERVTGYSQEDVVGKCPWNVLLGTEADATSVELMRNAIEPGESVSRELVQFRKDGSQFWATLDAYPIKSDAGEKTGFVILERDITSRVEAVTDYEQLKYELAEASRRGSMAEIATGVLHNVGNILNSVNVSASVIQRQFQKSALNNLQRLSGLVSENDESFADFVRDDSRGKKLPDYIVKVTDALAHERDEIGLEFQDLLKNVEHIKEIVSVQQSMATSSGVDQELSPEDLIRDLLVATKGSLNNHKIKITQHIDEVLPTLISDKHRILQILINLVGNARDAIKEQKPDQPEIQISVTSNGNEIRFRVTDNGTGIEKDKFEKVFQHGFTTKSSGHGFGLHSSMNAARDLGGRLSLSSDGIGMGATFVLAVPASSVQKPKGKGTHQSPTKQLAECED